MNGYIFGHANSTLAGDHSALRVLRPRDEACQNHARAWRAPGACDLPMSQLRRGHHDRERRNRAGFPKSDFRRNSASLDKKVCVGSPISGPRFFSDSSSSVTVMAPATPMDTRYTRSRCLHAGLLAIGVELGSNDNTEA